MAGPATYQPLPSSTFLDCAGWQTNARGPPTASQPPPQSRFNVALVLGRASDPMALLSSH
ncbi:MAG: hypothetical protein FJX11_18015 [Alphaproteobacteria bacterium]|nr:hypothetical protein [Alphaproteobacteria bacterium]